MALVAKGYDCSWDPPDQQCMKDQGCAFLVRYGSRDPSKNLTKAELDSALGRGLSVCVVWQEGKTQMERGYSGGQTDARDADAFVTGLGLHGIPVYFACDQDYEAASSSAKSAIDAYCDGAVSVIGLARMGGYGDDTFCQRQFNRGKITYGWQTYAWSEGMWETRAQLRQVRNNVTVCGGTIDDDEAWASDYGQWPRPQAAQPPGTGADVCISSAVDPDGSVHYAGLDENGSVIYFPPGWENWGRIDPGQSGAVSGTGISISSDWWVELTYTNGSRKPCKYRKKWLEGSWAWSGIGDINAR
jgi:hypothetical protein